MKPDIAASMTEFMGEAERLHVPVIDGVAAAINLPRQSWACGCARPKLATGVSAPRLYLGKLTAYAPATLFPAKEREGPACLAIRRS